MDDEGAALMKARRVLFLLLWMAFGFTGGAHIGSPNVYYEGAAGPYQVLVSILPPEVVPGRARINVRVQNSIVDHVAALPVRWDAGRKGSPRPDPAPRVEGETNLFSTELWLMDSGAYSVFVDLDGPLGKGTAIVPLNSVATQRLKMNPWLGALFLAGGALLIGLIVFIVGAAARESTLAPSSPVSAAAARRGRYGMAVAFLLLVLALLRGNAWWNEVDGTFARHRLYRTVEIPARVEMAAGGNMLAFRLEDPESGWRDNSPLVADHGKLVHLFLISKDENSFAHLHPRRRKSGGFENVLPPLPPGKYTLCADVTRESGLEQTYLAHIQIPPGTAASTASDLDDSWWSASSDRTVASANGISEIGHGARLNALTPLTVAARSDLTLRFEALAPDGKALPLEPYLGMWSHAVVWAKDGSVFTHIHPAGTISLTAQELFARRERGENLRKPIDVVCGRPEKELTFPFAFPKPGEYRVWVQVKSGGDVLTGAFDFHIVPPAS